MFIPVSYENGMIVCLKCKRFSHAECSEVSDIDVQHIYGTSAVKELASNVQVRRLKYS